MLSRVKDLLFPPKCAFCGKIVKSGRRICPECETTLPEATGLRAQKGGDFFEKCASPVYYTGVAKEGIHRYKFYGERWCATLFGDMLAEKIREELEGEFDIITWVPLSRKRLRERGYDQARLLARRAGKHLSMPVVRLLVKDKHIQPLSLLNEGAERRAQVTGIYRAVNTQDVKGRRVLLIDDVITTGSTLSECSRTLLMAGAERIVCATFARTKAR